MARQHHVTSKMEAKVEGKIEAKTGGATQRAFLKFTVDSLQYLSNARHGDDGNCQQPVTD
jgi:hypothetical protein